MAAFERVLSEVAVYGKLNFQSCESREKTKFKSNTTNMAEEAVKKSRMRSK